MKVDNVDFVDFATCTKKVKNVASLLSLFIFFWDREEVVNLLMAMTKVEMGANAAQLHSLRGDAEWGYDMAVTEPNFFK